MTWDKRVRLALVLAAVGCSRRPTSCGACSPASPAAATSAEVAKILAVELPPEDAAPDATDGEAFIDMVRRDAWEDARSTLEALPEEKKRKGTVRLVTARVAMALGDYATAYRSLDGLEKDLSPIADDIEKWRAESAAYAGPFEVAARYFEKQGGPKSLAKAALAFHKAGLDAEARSAADRSIAAGRGDASEVPVRALRAELAEAAGQAALAADDARFVVLRAPASDEAKSAGARLEKLDPSHPLTGKERLLCAERLVDGGKTDAALEELDRAEKSPGAPDGEEIAWARAFALYKARDRYEKAATSFAKLAQKPGRRQAEALYYAARAASRADRDNQAANEYRALAQRFPKSPWSEEASYLAARLSFLHAAWGDAVNGYADYLRRFPTGKQRDAAVYERSLALLADGNYKSARPELHAIAQSASSGSEAARLRELEGIAALGAGDKDAATSLWSDVARVQPLSWAALTARLHLAKLGETPPTIEPGDAAANEPVSSALPPIAQLYHRLGLDADAESYVRAHEREAVADAKGREKETLCALYSELGRAARQYRVGVDGVPAALLMRAPSPATEWAWRCVYPRPYADRVRDIETRETLPTGLIHAVMRQESAFDPDAISGAHAVGLLQIMPETARRLAAETGSAFDERQLRAPAVNLELGGRYLAKMLRSFHGSVPLAAAAYNAGPRAVRRWLERMKDLEIDVWVAAIPYEETRTYVSKVMSNLARYAYLDAGENHLPSVTLGLPSGSPPPKDDAPEY